MKHALLIMMLIAAYVATELPERVKPVATSGDQVVAEQRAVTYGGIEQSTELAVTRSGSLCPTVKGRSSCRRLESNHRAAYLFDGIPEPKEPVEVDCG